jgi:hypothetical protein
METHSRAAGQTEKAANSTPERYFSIRHVPGPITHNFKLVYSRQLSTEFRSETLERLLLTEAISSETLAFVLGGRLFGLKKPKAIALEKCGKMIDFRAVSDCHETYIERQDSISRTRLQVRFV